mmetsp:Transcript_90572/g.293187  ORF Transcript_90572/g.293187 Transcript_90572/m.293187 type:complete len:305 (-) Transcript_90572:63-977(-)
MERTAQYRWPRGADGPLAHTSTWQQLRWLPSGQHCWGRRRRRSRQRLPLGARAPPLATVLLPPQPLQLPCRLAASAPEARACMVRLPPGGLAGPRSHVGQPRGADGAPGELACAGGACPASPRDRAPAGKEAHGHCSRRGGGRIHGAAMACRGSCPGQAGLRRRRRARYPSVEVQARPGARRPTHRMMACSAVWGARIRGQQHLGLSLGSESSCRKCSGCATGAPVQPRAAPVQLPSCAAPSSGLLALRGLSSSAAGRVLRDPHVVHKRGAGARAGRARVAKPAQRQHLAQLRHGTSCFHGRGH